MIHWIPSPDDPRLEPYRHVGSHEWLRARNLFVAEGRFVVERLLALERFEVLSVLVNRAAHDAMLEELSPLEANVYVCEDATLGAVTGFNFHRGCLALASRPAPEPPDRFLGASRLVALQGVANPDNVGGIFRTAAALGADGVLLDGTAGDPFYRKAVRTSMGAALRLPFVRLPDWIAALDLYRTHGFRLAALTPHPDAVPIARFAREFASGGRLILLLGAEGHGLDPATLERADCRVRIPIDPAADSLNVVVASAIALERLRGDLA